MLNWPDETSLLDEFTRPSGKRDGTGFRRETPNLSVYFFVRANKALKIDEKRFQICNESALKQASGGVSGEKRTGP